MSKVSFSRELLGTIKFVFDKTKSRTLNATQAYDTSPSQIVLASYPATSTIKGPAKSLGDSPKQFEGFVFGTTSVQIGEAGYTRFAQLGSKLRNKDEQRIAARGDSTISLSWASGATLGSRRKNTKQVKAQNDTYHFSGQVWQTITNTDPIGDIEAARSKKTKEIYYGAMTVGTGLYREWQGKYAVLKVDILTNKAILRVYNE